MMRTFITANGSTVHIDDGKIEKIWAIARHITAVEHTTQGYFEVVRVRQTLAEIAIIAMLPLAKKPPLVSFSEAALIPVASLELFDLPHERIGYRLRTQPRYDQEYQSQAAAFIEQLTQTLAMIGYAIPHPLTETNDD